MPRELSLESEPMFLMAGPLQGPLRAASFPFVWGGDRGAPGPSDAGRQPLRPLPWSYGAFPEDRGGVREGV